MPDKLWLHADKLVVNATGKPVLSAACPCNWRYDSCVLARTPNVWQYDSCVIDRTPDVYQYDQCEVSL